MTWWDYVERVAGGLTQAAIAERMDITQGTVNRWRRSEPKPATVAAFARAFGRPVLEAFIGAGFLSAEDAQIREVPADLATVPSAALVGEIARRLDATR